MNQQPQQQQPYPYPPPPPQQPQPYPYPQQQPPPNPLPQKQPRTPKSKVEFSIIIIGVTCLIIGLLVTLLFWPVICVNGLGFYSGTDDLPNDVDIGDVFKVKGTIDRASTKEDYTIVLIKLENGNKLPWIVKDQELKEGNSILLVFEVIDGTKANKWIDEEKEESEESPDEFYKEAKGLNSDQRETVYDEIEDIMEEDGMKVSIEKVPTISSIIGLTIMILGIVLVILLMIKKKFFKTYR